MNVGRRKPTFFSCLLVSVYKVEQPQITANKKELSQRASNVLTLKLNFFKIHSRREDNIKKKSALITF
ncbi:hypothetical protein CGQ22_18765 [Bacillus sp. M13(2017)]|nr:hypothetical protein CGQ22_18765 [Bacillus sp. M13(2017)]PER91188.1 hypothetical protein CN500_29335 [Bacillus cereus]